MFNYSIGLPRHTPLLFESRSAALIVIPEDNNTAPTQQSRFSVDGWVENKLQAEGSNLMRVAVLVQQQKWSLDFHFGS